jgi:hypothetical protein
MRLTPRLELRERFLGSSHEHIPTILLFHPASPHPRHAIILHPLPITAQPKNVTRTQESQAF